MDINKKIKELINQDTRRPAGEQADLLIINDEHAVDLWSQNPDKFIGPSSVDGKQFMGYEIKVVAESDEVRLAKSKDV